MYMSEKSLMQDGDIQKEDEELFLILITKEIVKYRK